MPITIRSSGSVRLFVPNGLTLGSSVTLGAFGSPSISIDQSKTAGAYSNVTLDDVDDGAFGRLTGPTSGAITYRNGNTRLDSTTGTGANTFNVLSTPDRPDLQGRSSAITARGPPRGFEERFPRWQRWGQHADRCRVDQSLFCPLKARLVC